MCGNKLDAIRPEVAALMRPPTETQAPAVSRDDPNERAWERRDRGAVVSLGGAGSCGFVRAGAVVFFSVLRRVEGIIRVIDVNLSCIQRNLRHLKVRVINKNSLSIFS